MHTRKHFKATTIQRAQPASYRLRPMLSLAAKVGTRVHFTANQPLFQGLLFYSFPFPIAGRMQIKMIAIGTEISSRSRAAIPCAHLLTVKCACQI